MKVLALISAVLIGANALKMQEESAEGKLNH
jgi:hypothetical protein